MPEVESRPWNLLLIEDDEDDFILTRALLSVTRGDRFQLNWAKTYQEALEQIEDDNLDVVLVDHYLGKKTGLDLVREARTLGKTVPFILLTGNGSYELDVEATNAGATDYLVKGEVSPPLLERTIRYAIARSKAEQEIGRRKDHIEVQHRLIEQREIERLKIAQDLHDGPLQELIGMIYIVQDVLQSIETPDKATAVPQKLTSVLGTLQEQVNEMRSFCGELRPPALAPYGLATAIRSHADTYRHKHPELTLRLELDQDHQRLPEQVRLALYRIYQELLNNIIKHAGATETEVRMKLSEHEVLLEVKDNGTGFNVPYNWIEYARRGHLGLVGVQERAEAAGGFTQIMSAPGIGTTVQVRVPY